jgi:hypothetical protein
MQVFLNLARISAKTAPKKLSELREVDVTDCTNVAVAATG